MKRTAKQPRHAEVVEKGERAGGPTDRKSVEKTLQAIDRARPVREMRKDVG
jgi:hypothetical protein